jgi:hypothetical protein
LKAARWSCKASQLQRRMGGNAGCFKIYRMRTFYVFNRSPVSWICKRTAHFPTGCRSYLKCSSRVHLRGSAMGI